MTGSRNSGSVFVRMFLVVDVVLPVAEDSEQRSGEVFERTLRPRIRRIHVTCSAATTGADFLP